MVYSDPETGGKATLAWTSDPTRKNWSISILDSDTPSGWEPDYDPTIWKRDGKLDIFFQTVSSGVATISVMEIDPNVFLTNQPNVLTWANANSGNWSAPANWAGGTAPFAGGAINTCLNFYGGASYAVTNDLVGAFQLSQLTFNNSTTVTNSIVGNPLAFIGYGPNPAILTQSGTAAFSIANALTLNANLYVSGNSTAPVFINGNISGAGGIILNGGTLVLAASNSYSGGTTINAGQLVAASSSALGLGSSLTNVLSPGGTSVANLALQGGIILAEPVQCAGRQPLPNASALAAHIINLSGTNILVGDITATTGGNQYNIESAAGLLTISGNYYQTSGTGPRFLNLQGAGNADWIGTIQNGTASLIVTKRGSGRWILSGMNTFSNTNVISGGTEWVNGRVGPGQVIVNGGTLGGHGTITGSTDIQAGGTLAPASPSISALTINNNLKFESGSTNIMELDGTNQTNDQLIVAGTLTFGGTLVVTNISGYVTAGDIFKLFSAAHYVGGFAKVNLPPLGIGLAWKTNSLITNGIISVIATASPAKFSSVFPINGGGFIVNGSGAAGVTYELDAATNLLSPINWMFVTNAVADQDGLFQLIDSQNEVYQQRFYRIKSFY